MKKNVCGGKITITISCTFHVQVNWTFTQTKIYITINHIIVIHTSCNFCELCHAQLVY